MSSKNCHNKKTRVPYNTTGNHNKSNLNKEILTFAPIFAYINLTISSIGSTYRAYANNDTAMVAFIMFVFLGYLVLEICFRALNRLPQSEESTKKLLLKITIWVLSSSILFAFAYQFGRFACLAVTVVTSCGVIASSAFIFFAYFIYDDKKSAASINGISDEKNKFNSWSSNCPGIINNDDYKCGTDFVLERV